MKQKVQNKAKIRVFTIISSSILKLISKHHCEFWYLLITSLVAIENLLYWIISILKLMYQSVILSISCASIPQLPLWSTHHCFYWNASNTTFSIFIYTIFILAKIFLQCLLLPWSFIHLSNPPNVFSKPYFGT